MRNAEHWAGTQSFSITASFGVAGMAVSGVANGPRSGDELFALADAALYAAKREGRDRVVVSGVPRLDSQRPTGRPPGRPLAA